MNRRSEKAESSLLQVNLSPNLVNDRKLQIVCTGAKIEAFKKCFSLLEYILLKSMFWEEKM